MIKLTFVFKRSLWLLYGEAKSKSKESSWEVVQDPG